MNKLAAVIIAATAVTFPTRSLAGDSDILDYFDPLRDFEVVLITPTLEAGSKKITAGASNNVKRKSLAGSNPHTLAAATGNYFKPIRH
jgi:hypothetical protein